MANRFWVGGTGTWDATTQTHWSTTTGPGNAPQTAPGSGDVAIFDGASGGGTVTVNWASGTVAVQSITCGAFTGTLDFSANNNNVTLTATTGMNLSGTGARTINLGNGVWTLSATATGTVWNAGTVTSLTFNANSSNITLSGAVAAGSARTFAGGGLTYSTITISGSGYTTFTGGAFTITTLSISSGNTVSFPTGGTTTITNAFTWTGTAASPIDLISNGINTTATISVGSGAPAVNWAGLRDLTFSGGATFTAVNSFDFGHNSGITITPPNSGFLL